MSDMLEAALSYAQRGMFVIPAQHPILRDGVLVCSCGHEHKAGKMGKEPAIGWKQYQNIAPTVSQVRQHFSGRFFGYNIAAVHGAASGTVLLDWDGMEGFSSRRQLEKELGELPDTPTVLSGGGGSHELYKHPGVHVPTNKGLRESFDVRGDGGISIMPPSQHEFGVYQWECDKSLDDLPFADLPQPWVDFITASPSVSGIGKSSNQSVPLENVQWEPAHDGSMIVTDGREIYMRDVVWKSFNQLRTTSHVPSPQEVYDIAVCEYMAHVDPSRPGRGTDELWRKCNEVVMRNRNTVPKGLRSAFLKGKR